MQRLFAIFSKRTVSTRRVDDMPSSVARAALDQRLTRMLALHAGQPLPSKQPFSPLSNPIQNPKVS